MKIALAQVRSHRGDITRNLARHKQFVLHAATFGAHAIFFPELSLTGYEPPLARQLAASPDDKRFNDLRQLSDKHNMIIGAGMPTGSDAGIHITMLLFHPDQPWQTYSKQYLHTDEVPFFVPGNHPVFLRVHEQHIALAICYEISVPEHAAAASEHAAGIYLASVAKTANGVIKAAEQLSSIATRYGMVALMVNAVGECDDGICAGRSAVWNNKGALMGELDDVREGLLLFDTQTSTVITGYI